MKLAALDVLPNTDSATLEKIKVAVAESFVSGFPMIMFVSAALAVASGTGSCSSSEAHVWLDPRSSEISQTRTKAPTATAALRR